MHIYSHYKELEEVTEMTDESFLLDIEIMEKEHQKQIEKIQAEKDEALAEIASLKKKLADAGIE